MSEKNWLQSIKSAPGTKILERGSNETYEQYRKRILASIEDPELRKLASAQMSVTDHLPKQ